MRSVPDGIIICVASIELPATKGLENANNVEADTLSLKFCKVLRYSGARIQFDQLGRSTGSR